MRPFYILLLPLFFFSTCCFSQNSYPQNYFGSPIKKELSLVGNFGEIRPNHFHAGFDIRTNNQEGMPVYAVADGYVSRIKISAGGYGKALYVTHPNGYTSVYGHLRGFYKDIASYSKTIQYSKETFEMDTILPANALPVKKGEQIAFSGNTGSSTGPHLHFEIRETKTEMPVNPYYFGYKVPDNTKPQITEIAIYPLNEQATVNGKHIVKKIKPTYNKDKNTYSVSDTITVSGDIGFGIGCFDTETGATNHNGVFSIELQVGGKRVYYHQLEKFTFENSRFVNAHIDYPEKQKHNIIIQKCYLAKNNKIDIYKDVLNLGIITFRDDSIHLISYIVKDFVGNTSKLSLKVRSKSEGKKETKTKETSPNWFDCFKENKITTDDFQLTIPPYSLYDDLDFRYYKTLEIKGPYSAIHHIESDETALQKPYTLGIKAVHIPDSLLAKACIVSMVLTKGKYVYEGGVYKDGWVYAQPTHFGNFLIAIDKSPPTISPVFKIEDKQNVNLTKASKIEIKATDNLSGIKTYRATIDGKWVLCEYEPKKELLFYTFDEQIKPGKHTFKLEVGDEKQNFSSIQFTFSR